MQLKYDVLIAHNGEDILALASMAGLHAVCRDTLGFVVITDEDTSECEFLQLGQQSLMVSETKDVFRWSVVDNEEIEEDFSEVFGYKMTWHNAILIYDKSDNAEGLRNGGT